MQVEQPFEIVPMTSICNLLMRNLEETFIAVPPDGGEGSGYSAPGGDEASGD